MRGFIFGDPTAGGAQAETYVYDSSNYRIVTFKKTGRPVVGVRGDGGLTLSEFEVIPNNSSPTLTRDFLYGVSQALIERKVAVTAPQMTTHNLLKTGTLYNFKLTSGVGQAAYAVDISAGSGWRRVLTGVHPDASGVFSIQESEFAPDETNIIRIRIESPEVSGYSAPVSLTYDTAVTAVSANQIRTIAVARNGNDLIVRWVLNQSNGKSTKLYFRRADGAATYVLTPQALPTSVTEFTLNSQALASPCGGFYGTQFSVGVETNGGKEAGLGSDRSEEQGTQDGCGNPQPPIPTPTIHFVNLYRHLDHLGSLRVGTRDNGEPSARIDYYPYGAVIGTSVWDSAGGAKFFAGMERDLDTGNDYALARLTGGGQCRFLSVDPGPGRLIGSPGSWNRYSYANNDPLSLWDPDGRWPKPARWRAVNNGDTVGAAETAGAIAGLTSGIKKAAKTVADALGEVFGKGVEGAGAVGGPRTPAQMLATAEQKRTLEALIVLSVIQKRDGVTPSGADWGSFVIDNKPGYLSGVYYWTKDGDKVTVWTNEKDKQGQLVGVLYWDANNLEGPLAPPGECDKCTAPEDQPVQSSSANGMALQDEEPYDFSAVSQLGEVIQGCYAHPDVCGLFTYYKPSSR